ncbi:hypothetical protein C8D88_102799 [Lentzea atacamensis]|uniref:Uncharacterized protein n=1 Tax=Lentzea atacamensis TaxID=531938 RepID=A0A316IQW2_9PSEU|nr:hypothetical protein C8D88_102799 [Lentzea atacamensis]
MTSGTIVEKSRSNAGSRCGNGLTEQPPNLVKTFRHRDVPAPRATTFAAHEAGIGEHSQMVTDRALTQAEAVDKVADARLPARCNLQKAEQRETRWTGERLEHLGDTACLGEIHALTE